ASAVTSAAYSGKPGCRAQVCGGSPAGMIELRDSWSATLRRLTCVVGAQESRCLHARRHPAPESDGSGASGWQSSEDRDMSYGPAITLETVKKAAAAAMAEV